MNGIWNAEFAEHHQSSEKFAKWLSYLLPDESCVIDFGCGTGYYMGYLEQHGFNAIGIDGYNIDNPLCSDFRVHDLSQPLNLGIKGTVVSLEVGEHIAAEAQETFMQTLVNHCEKYLVLSWASVGQPGIGHINCRHQKDVIDDVCARGFYYLPFETLEARQHVDRNCDWLERNVLIFERCTH